MIPDHPLPVQHPSIGGHSAADRPRNLCLGPRADAGLRIREARLSLRKCWDQVARLGQDAHIRLVRKAIDRGRGESAEGR